MKKAIVLGCHDVGFEVIRALAVKNVKVMAIPTSVFDFAQFSRFTTIRTERIFLRDESTELKDFLLNLKKSWEGALILPTSDDLAAYISQKRKALSLHFVPAIQEWDIISRIYNKALLYQNAQEKGIPLPKTFFPITTQELMQKNLDITYPCILKPHEKHKFFPIFKTKVLIIKNFDELIEKFNLVQGKNIQIMISEIIPGSDDHFYHYISYINRNNKVVAELCVQKLRQDPPGFGNPRVAKTIPMIQEIKDIALKLLKGFHYRGFSQAEFKFDERDNQYKLIEINIRPVLHERLFRASGINFPYMTYLDYIEKTDQASLAYKKDIHWIDLYADIYNFIKSKKIERYSLMDYLRPYLKTKVFCTPFFDDPLPLIVRFFILLKEHTKSYMTRKQHIC